MESIVEKRSVVMKKTSQNIVVILLLVLLSVSLAQASTPLVTPEWLMENIDDPELRILDLQHPKAYPRAHLPGAINTDYGKWRKTGKNGVPSLIPEPAYLEKLIGGLGISNSTQVVLAPLGAGAGDMAVATRIYWTFKAMGHDKISILDGGLIAYSKLPKARFTKQNFTAEPVVFKANVREEYFPGAAQVKEALDRGVTFVDSRSKPEYIGKVSGDKKERPGTIPGSIHLPYDSLVKPRSGFFHSKDKLQEIYQASGVPLTGEQISFCHTGHRTSLSWFVSHELLGNKDARMYDGSTVEWASTPDLPLTVLKQK